jgi:hypothetical protein
MSLSIPSSGETETATSAVYITSSETAFRAALVNRNTCKGMESSVKKFRGDMGLSGNDDFAGWMVDFWLYYRPLLSPNYVLLLCRLADSILGQLPSTTFGCQLLASNTGSSRALLPRALFV